MHSFVSHNIVTRRRQTTIRSLITLHAIAWWYSLAGKHSIMKHNAMIILISAASRVIRPFSATLSTTYVNDGNVYPASFSIDNNPATYAEADLDDTESWLLMTFSNTDIPVREVTLILYSTATGVNAQNVELVGRLMTDAVVYVVDSAENKHLCGVLELDTSDASLEGQTYDIPCKDVLGNQIRVESSAGTIPWDNDRYIYNNNKTKHVIVAEATVTALNTISGFGAYQISSFISDRLGYSLAGKHRIMKHNAIIILISAASRVIRPFSATLSTTYVNDGNVYPAEFSIDNNPATYAEADLDDTASWLLMTFSNTDIPVREVTLILYSTATGVNAQNVELVGRLMTDAVVYVVDSAENKHLCGVLELDTSDASLEGQTYDIPCKDVLGNQIRVESSAGTIPWDNDRYIYNNNKTKHVIVAEATVTALNTISAPECPEFEVEGSTEGNWTAEEVMTLVSIECVTNYILVGSANLTCQEDGSWSSDIPECVAASRVIRPFSATLSTTYVNDGNVYPASFSIAHNPATYAEADLDDTASWLLMTFSNTDIPVREVTLILYSTATGVNAQNVELVGRLMTDAVVYVVDSAENKHLCGVLQLDTSDASLEGQTYDIPCKDVLGNQIRVESSAGTIPWDNDRYIYNNNKTKHVIVAEATVTALNTISAPECPEFEVEGSTEGNWTAEEVGTLVSIECVTNYILVGSANLTCQEDGSWSSDIPECVGKYIVFRR
eukprot:sb/3462486/